MAEQKTRVLISYAHRDGVELALRLERDLSSRLYDVWLDRQRINAGANWSTEIENEIDSANVVLALLSEGSFASEVCRGEQLRSLRRHKCLIPVLVHAGADVPVYLEARQYCDFSEEQSYQSRLDDLITAIDARSGAGLVTAFYETRYETVPPLPLNFVPRLIELDSLRRLILADRENREVSLVSLRGTGGLGKTVLAQALCRDEAVQAAFPDGVVWVKIGADPTEADLVAQMRETAKALGAGDVKMETIGPSSNVLRTLLQDKAVLLVLDDVWQVKHIEMFQPANPRFSRLLFTTRDQELAAATGAREFLLGFLDDAQSRSMLSKFAGLSDESLPDSAARIIRKCDGLALALAMIGAMLYKSSPALWVDVLDSLEQADVDEIRLQFPNYEYPSLIAAIDVSVRALDPEVQKRYLALSVLPEDTAIPGKAFEVIWDVPGKLARKTISQLVKRSLASDNDAGGVVFHDLHLAYLRKRAGDVRALHAQLVESYRQRSKDGWESGPDDGYFFQFLTYHLNKADRHAELQSLLLEFGWMQARLKVTGVAGLLADYDRTLLSQPLERVQEAIRLSANVLSDDQSQLAGHLHGRLLGEQDPLIQTLLLKVRQARKADAWLRPLTASLTIPGGPLVRTLVGSGGWLRDVAISRDGETTITASESGALDVWDIKTGFVVRTISVKQQVTGLALSPDGNVVLGILREHRIFHFSLLEATKSDAEHVVKVWDVKSASELRVLKGHTAEITAVALTPNGRRAVTASKDGTLIVWDLATGERVRTLAGHEGGVIAVVVTPDGRFAVSAGDERDPTLRVWDLDSGEQVNRFSGHVGAVTAVAVSQDGRLAVSASEDKTVKVWDLVSRALLRTIEGHTDPIWDVAITPDGLHLISGAGDLVYSEDNTVKVWDVSNGRLVRTLSGHGHRVSAVAVMPDSRTALSVSLDGTMKIWDLTSGLETPATRHEDDVNDLAVTPDGSVAVSAANDKTLKVWSASDGALLRTLTGHTSSVEKLALAPNSQQAVSAAGNYASAGPKELKVWDLGSGQAIHTLSVPDYIRALVVTPDGRLAIFAGNSGDVDVYDLSTGTQTRTLTGHSDWVFTLAVTPDSRFVLSGGNDNSVRVWDLASGEAIKTLLGRCGYVTDIAVTADSRFAISALGDATLKVWDLATGTVVATLVGHETIVNSVTTNSNGDYAVSSSGDGKLIVWDTGTWKPISILVGHQAAVYDVATTLDGSFVVSASVDETLRVWNYRTGQQVAVFRGEGGIQSCACAPDGRTFLAGDRSGGVHFLYLELAESAVPQDPVLSPP